MATMRTAEVPIVIETAGGQPPASPVAIDTAGYTQCASYKEAKYLAGSRRREGAHAYAVYLVAMDHWCVR